MANINRDEILKDVRKIINESIQEKPSMYDVTKKFNIQRYITGLIAEGHKNPDLMNMLVRYDNMLKQGAKDFMIFEQFGHELSHFATGNNSVKAVIKEMNETLASNGMELVGYQLIENITDPYTKNTVSESFTNYVSDKCSETLNHFVDSLDLVYHVNENLAMKLNLLTTTDVNMSDRFIHSDYVTNELQEALNRQLQEAREKRQAEEIYEKVELYLKNTLEAHEAKEADEKSKLCLEAIANNNGINLGTHLANIANSDAKTNQRLMQVVEAYHNAIQQGAYEERLYETFILNVSKFNYLIPVDKAIKAINEAVNNKKEEITLTQILEEMKDNQYSFIYVDLIEEDVARYVKDPNPTNRVQLRNAIAPYASDPYINEMFKVIYADNLKRDNELSEKALNIRDQINIIRENASVSSIYTPVQYIKENECVFNVNGQYYIKKGNSIAVLEERYTDQLDEAFVELCHLVNDPHVEINEDYIEVYGNNNLYAKVFEGYVDVLGVRESRESLRDLRTMCMKHDNYDTNFYIMCSCLLENFNNIAKIDWAKHVTLNENHNISADLFKLDENIFIATHNDSLRQHTFYRNVNPIFCKNKLNEHMGINVSSLFTDLLPSQDRIILKLNETKSSYEESIEKYEDMIEQLKDMESQVSEENKEEITNAIADAESKLEDLKKEYKEWQEHAAEATGEAEDETDDNVETSDEAEDSENGTVTKEPSNEPASEEEVKDQYNELTQPIDNATSEEAPVVSDEEFGEFLGDETEDSEEADDTEVVVDGEESDEDIFEPDTEDSEEDFDNDVDDQEEFAEVSFGDEETDETPAEEPTEDIVTDDSISDDDVFDNGREEPVPASVATADVPVEEPVVEPEEETSDEYDGHAATDAFGGDTQDPLDVKYDKEELPANTPSVETEEPIEDTTPDFAYKIANVMFDENVKTGVAEKSGSVIAIIPMVNGEGKRYIENKTITFYIDADGRVILNNEEMSSDLYNAVISSITSHPSFSTVCKNGAEPENMNEFKPDVSDTEADKDALSWEDEYMRDGNDEDRNIFSQEPQSEETPDADDWSYLDSLIDKKKSEETAAEGTVGVASDEPKDEFADYFKDDEHATEVTVEQPAELTEEPAMSLSDVMDKEPEEAFSMDDEESDEEGNEDIVIPAYKDGETEIELPAANVDDTVIPESVNTPKKKALKESIKVSAVYKHKGQEKSFFVNEATINASNKKQKQQNTVSVKSEIVDGGVQTNNVVSVNENLPIENYNEDTDTDTLSRLCNYCEELITDCANNGLITGEVSDIKIYGDELIPSEHIIYFDVEGDLSKITEGVYEAYRIFQYETSIYYIPVKTVVDIEDNNKYEDTSVIIKEIVDNAEMSVSIDNYDDCMFMCESVVKSLYHYYVNENCKIRKQTKIQTDNDVKLSKTAHDAKYGTEEENDFKQELEDKQKKDGTIGALDPLQQEESVKPILPNVNLITEGKYEIIYEVNDPVIYKDEIWHVYAIDEFDTDKQRLHITKNGETQSVMATDVEPDPEFLKNLEDTGFDYDSDNLQGMITKKDLKDLNKKTVECNIVVDGYTINSTPLKASLSDIMESNDYLNVEGEDGNVNPMPISSLSFDMENWPYAVIANEEDEPLRKIRVNPTSYINAKEDDDMVEVTVADKLTKLPKRSIRILS